MFGVAIPRAFNNLLLCIFKSVADSTKPFIPVSAPTGLSCWASHCQVSWAGSYCWSIAVRQNFVQSVARNRAAMIIPCLDSSSIFFSAYMGIFCSSRNVLLGSPSGVLCGPNQFILNFVSICTILCPLRSTSVITEGGNCALNTRNWSLGLQKAEGKSLSGTLGKYHAPILIGILIKENLPAEEITEPLVAILYMVL